MPSQLVELDFLSLQCGLSNGAPNFQLRLEFFLAIISLMGNSYKGFFFICADAFLSEKLIQIQKEYQNFRRDLSKNS